MAASELRRRQYALLTQLYGVILAVLCLIAATIVARKHPATRPDSECEQLSRHALAVATPATAVGVLASMALFLIVGLAMSGVAN